LGTQPIVLRRIASDLFWTARYLERAQWRARLADVNYHLLLEVPPRDIEPWEPLLEITGERALFNERYAHADEQSVLDFFTFDRENPSSIWSCIHAARSNISPLRHRVSSELWFELNGLYLKMQDWSPQCLAAAGVFNFFADLRNHFYCLEGIINSTLSRDLAFELMQVGALLERTDNIARMLDVKYHYLLPRLEDIGGHSDLRQWAAVLRSASALEAYRKVHGAIGIEQVVDMLLFDPYFPRSTRFCVDRLTASLMRIGAEETGMRPASRILESEALRDLLTTGDAAMVISDGLHEFLLRVEHECAVIGSMVFGYYLSTG
jgi:uncharacterized alpha-E superfamily protein